MTIKLHELAFVHSGGSANESPGGDLGGAISTATNKRVKSQTASALVNITGVTVIDAFGNAQGVGVLSYNYTTKVLSWKPYGGSSYNGESVIAGGTFLIGAGTGYLIVSVSSGSLPTSDKIDTISISHVLENVFDNVTPAQCLAGKTSYRCHYILNTSITDTANNVTLWLKSNTIADDTLYIGLGTANIGGTEQTIVNETTAPSGINWLQPASKATGISIGNIPPGSYKSIWLKRVVPAETRGTVAANTAVVAMACDL